MSKLFESEPNPSDPLDGIDLLYGIQDMSNGKVLDFFRVLALTRGISDQQVFARLASTIFYPHHIDAYSESLVVRLHDKTANRRAPAWDMARDEVNACLTYLDIFSEHSILPMPTSVVSKYSQELAWNMMHPGQYQNYAGLFIPRIEIHARFCEDPTAIDDINERVIFYRDLFAEG